MAKGYLQEQMEIFENENSGATYSLIRIKSGPEYWNTMLSYENSQYTTITDPFGRIWECINIPHSCFSILSQGVV